MRSREGRGREGIGLFDYYDDYYFDDYYNNDYDDPFYDINLDYYNDDEYFNYHRDYRVGDFEVQRENNINQNSQSLEYLLENQQIIDSNISEEEKEKIFGEIDLNKKNINELKENLIYYFSSPESLSNFKSIRQEEINYDYYKNLDCQNFILSQKNKFKKIISILNSDFKFQMKKRNFSNFNTIFSPKLSLTQDNEETKNKLINTSLIGLKMDEFSYLYSGKEVVDDIILINYLDELKNIFEKNIIDMNSIGLLHFNFIERNLINILSMIENKFVMKNNSQELKNFVNTFTDKCLDILKVFKSNKLFFHIIKFIKDKQKLLDSYNLYSKPNLFQFISNNCINFEKLSQYINKVLIKDLSEPLINNDNNKKKYFNDMNINMNEYFTLNYNDYLLLFIGFQDNLKEIKEFNIFIFYKIDLINKSIIDIGKIYLLNEEEEKNQNLKILDINISIKKEFIFIFYIIENSLKYVLKYKLFYKNSIILENEGEIELKNSFIPKSLINDNNYLYCISEAKEIF